MVLELSDSVPERGLLELVKVPVREPVGPEIVSFEGGDVSSGGYGAGPLPERLSVPLRGPLGALKEPGDVPVGTGKEELGGGIPTLGPVVAGEVKLESVPDLGLLVLLKVPVEEDEFIWPEAAVLVAPGVPLPAPAPPPALLVAPAVPPVDRMTVVSTNVLVVIDGPVADVPLTGRVEPDPPLASAPSCPPRPPVLRMTDCVLKREVEVTVVVGAVWPPPPPPDAPSSPPRPPELRMTDCVLKRDVEVTVVVGAVWPPAPPSEAPSSPPRPPELRMTVCVLNDEVEVSIGGGVEMAPEAMNPDPPLVAPGLKMTVCVDQDDTEDVILPAPLPPTPPDWPPSTA